MLLVNGRMVVEMKKIIILPIIVLLFLTLVFAEDYYVTQDGIGADYSAAQFNSLSGDHSGDTFYFSGDFSTNIAPASTFTGSASGPVTLDGYAAGDCDPLNAVCSSSALLNLGMWIEGDPSYMIIQDFRMRISDSSNWIAFGFGGTAIDHFIFRRNLIDDTSCRGFQIGSGSYSASEYIIVENNKITNFAMRADGIGECTGFVFVHVNHALIKNNIFGHDNPESSPCSECSGTNVGSVHYSSDVLFENNDVYGAPQQTGLAVKELANDGTTPQSRMIFRYNKFHDNSNEDWYNSWGLSLAGGNDPIEYMYVYANNFYNNFNSGLGTYHNADDIYIWSNIFHNNGQHGLWTSGSTNNHVLISNNIFARNSGFGDTPENFDRGAIVLGSGSENTVKNNFFYNNRPDGAGGYYHQIYDNSNNLLLEHNTYYHSIDNTYQYYLFPSTSVGLPTLQNPPYDMEDDPPVGDIEDPVFTDPNGADSIHGTVDDDYRLASATPTDGADLSQCFSVDLSGGDAWMEANSGYSRYIEPCLDDGLDPINTDWTTIPPTVATLKRDTYGWERGAYVYTGDITPTCSEGQITLACLCGGIEYSSGYCCSGSWQSTSCSATPTCAEGQITSTCLCGGIEYSSGYCCSNVWHSSQCVTATEYTIKKTSTPPAIDGDISEFSGADEITITEPGSGTTGKYRLMWDDNAFYIAAQITDSNLNANSAHQEDGYLFEDDSLEIMFDTENNGGTSPQSDDYKFFVNVNNIHADSQAYDTNWDSGMTSEVSVVGTINNNADTDTRYTIEVKIPWINWAQPTETAIWGMNIALKIQYPISS